jgi:hypothetical protein
VSLRFPECLASSLSAMVLDAAAAYGGVTQAAGIDALVQRDSP